MSEVNLEELREKARTNYGITNADDLDAGRLQEEMDAIDKQAKVAEKEQADITRNPDAAASNSTVPPTVGASDGNTAATDDGETDEEDAAKPLSKQTKAELLATAEAESVEVDEADTVPVLREKIAAAREDADDSEDDEEDDNPPQV